MIIGIAIRHTAITFSSQVPFFRFRQENFRFCSSRFAFILICRAFAFLSSALRQQKEEAYSHIMPSGL
jgi:hypothetical protein